MKTKQLCFPISALSTRLRLYSTLWVPLFSLVSLSISLLFLSNAHAQDDTQMGLPEGAKYRIGKGTLHGGIALFAGRDADRRREPDRCLDIRCTNG